MKPNTIPYSFVFLLMVLSFSCGPVGQTQRTFTPPASWPTINKSEANYRKYLDDNSDKLNPIEGIWTITQSGAWRNVYSGMTGSIPSSNTYRIAIVADSSTANYEFVAVILESQYTHWPMGRVKAHLRKTAYEKVYEALWYMSDYSEQRSNYIMDESGLVKNTITAYDPDNQYIENTFESIMIKAYPPITGKSRPSTEKGLKSSGSGFLLTSTGLVVTNYHVVEDANRIEVTFADKNITKSASVRIKDTKNDIAILEVKEFSFADLSSQPIPYAFADVNSIKVGQEVFTLGFPLGDIMGTKSRLSTGRINSQFGIQDDPRLFQISNPLQPGNSGGPLFNSKGELVGIVVSSLNAKYFYENTGTIPQNVNFAVKASYLQSLVSMMPDGEDATKRKNIVKTGPMENQIEQLNPFIVQVRVY